MSEIAREIGVSRSHLARAFRTWFATSPGEFQRHCRVQAAADRLAHTDISLIDIALQCGFYDQSHLTNALRSAVGMTPTEIRWRSKFDQSRTAPDARGKDLSLATTPVRVQTFRRR